MLEFAGSPNAEATEFAVQRCGGVDRGEAKEMEPPGSNGSCFCGVTLGENRLCECRSAYLSHSVHTVGERILDFDCCETAGESGGT